MPEVCLRNNVCPDDPDILNAVEAGILEIDNDNAPTPENVPIIEDVTRDECQYNIEKGHEGICFQRYRCANSRNRNS